MTRAATFEQAATLQFGAATIKNLYIPFGDFKVFKIWGMEDQPALLVGMDILGTFAEISIDYRRHELGILPRPSQVVLLR